MKKMLSTLAVCVLLANNIAFAAEGYVFTAADAQKAPVYTQSLQRTNLPYGEYLKYYNVNPSKIDADFIVLSKDEEKKFVKTLSKSEKENYEYAKKVQKLVQKRDWNKVFDKYPNYFPAYLQYFDECYSKGHNAEALRILKKINEMDRKGQVFDIRLVNYTFGTLHFSLNQFNQALSYFKMYESSGDDLIIASIANCYYGMKNYQSAIKYSKQLKEMQYPDKELLYASYFAMKDYPQANKYALELLNELYCFDNLMKVQATSSYDNTKLSYAYKAREVAQDDSQIMMANDVIAMLEQKKLDASGSKTNQFVKIPKWVDYVKQMPQGIPVAEITEKQDEFFKTANQYLKKYQGQQLTNAFNSLSQEFNTYVQNKKTEYYQAQQLEAQKALLIEQQRSNAIQQQRNYIEAQRMYYLTRPYYSPRYYGWW